MPTPTSFRPARNVTAGRATRMAGTANDWRCNCCGKLLGVRRDGLMHLSFARGHEYLVGFPATATCRGCGTLNQATAPAR
ncbi:hypothetical protein [Paracoccus sphaerophysae]|uniref:Uncharacterized protein n=1 Tax=Paracoccus sphaerophysae TaxID=690417 RepID=A0A099FHI6_9RHOB|nr:hypothetical protein [Paracoccus sphaerophysae]KGJ09731.1 hypothetical protein IC63_00895 [Paracoccus sphaerophysae]